MLMRLGMAQHWIIVRFLEKVDVIVFSIDLKTAFKILRVPLFVVIGFQFTSTISQVVIATAHQDHRVGIDVRLELRRILLC